MSTIPKKDDKSGVSGFISKVLNEGNDAILGIFDGVSYGCSRVKDGCIRLKDGLKKTPEVTKKVSTKARQLYDEGKLKIDINQLKALKKVKHSQSKELSEKIKKREKKIAALYYRIGKEGAQVTEQQNPLEQENIKKLIADVRGYEKEIERLKNRINDLETQKDVAPQKPKREVKPEQEKPKVVTTNVSKPTEEKPKERNMERVARARMARARIEKEKQEKATPLDTPQTIRNRSLRTAITASLKTARFKAQSERAKFETVANDLMDPESEIRMLAAAEMAKIGNLAAVPILIAAANDPDPYLVAETLNSLIVMGDSRALNVLKEKITDPHYRVRIAALRGLYKMADNDLIKMASIEAIKDDHPEVRKTAITFIGWKDFSEGVPPLVQSLNDDDERVKKAAIASLANIRDKAAVMPLIKILSDSSLEVREKALSAIQMIVGEEISFDAQLTGDALSEAQKNLKQWWQQRRISVAQEEPDLESLDIDLPPIDTPPQKLEPSEKKPDTKTATQQPEPKPQQKIAPQKPDTKVTQKPDTPSEKIAQEVKTPQSVNKPPSAVKQESVKTDETKPAAPESKKPTREELKLIEKNDLIAMAKKMGVETDESYTKNRIIKNILDKVEHNNVK